MLKNIFKILLAPMLVFFIHLIICFIIPLYKWWPNIDILMHLLGGTSIAIAAIIYLQLLTKKEKCINLPLSLKSVVILGAVCSMAVLWEFFEFSSDYLFHTTMQLGLNDTMGDLFFGILGGSVVLIFYLKQNIKKEV